MTSTKGQDHALTWAAFAATLLGFLTIWDAGYARAAANGQLLPREFLTQVVASVVALVAAWFVMRVKGEKWKVYGPWVLIAAIVGLALVQVPGLGKSSGGAKLWLDLRVGTLQPSEFAKWGVILFLSAALAARAPWQAPRIRNFGDRIDREWIPRLGRGWPLLVVALVLILIELGPDLATMAVVVVSTAVILVAGKVNARSLMLLGTAAALGVGVLMTTESYRMERITQHAGRWSEANRDSIGFQTTMAEIAFASGGLTGVGLGEGQAKHTLPAPTTDFVLATVGEEFGFLGSLVVIGLLGFITYRLMARGAVSRDLFTRMVLMGTGAWVGIQSAVNIMMTNGFLPPIGIPLPFFSYGGSSLIAMWMALACCQSLMAAERAEEPEQPAPTSWRNRAYAR